MAPVFLAIGGCLFLVVIAVAGVGVWGYSQFSSARDDAMAAEMQRAFEARGPIDVKMDVAPPGESPFVEEIREEKALERPGAPPAPPAPMGDAELAEAEAPFEEEETDAQLRHQLRQAEELQREMGKRITELDKETVEQHKRMKAMAAKYEAKLRELQMNIVLLNDEIKKARAELEAAKSEKK